MVLFVNVDFMMVWVSLFLDRLCVVDISLFCDVEFSIVVSSFFCVRLIIGGNLFRWFVVICVYMELLNLLWVLFNSINVFLGLVFRLVGMC